MSSLQSIRIFRVRDKLVVLGVFLGGAANACAAADDGAVAARAADASADAVQPRDAAAPEPSADAGTLPEAAPQDATVPDAGPQDAAPQDARVPDAACLDSIDDAGTCDGGVLSPIYDEQLYCFVGFECVVPCEDAGPAVVTCEAGAPLGAVDVNECPTSTCAPLCPGVSADAGACEPGLHPIGLPDDDGTCVASFVCSS